MPKGKARKRKTVPVVINGTPTRAIIVGEYLKIREGELRAALGDVIAIIDAIGGYMTAEDQQRLRNARAVHGGS